MRFLLSAGAPPDAPNNADRTPLHSAVHNKLLSAVQLLVLEGAAGISLRDEDGAGQSPLQAAASAFERGSEAQARMHTWSAATAMRERARATNGRWAVADMKSLLAAAQTAVGGSGERADLQRACESVVRGMPEVLSGVRTGLPFAAMTVLRANYAPMHSDDSGEQANANLDAAAASASHADRSSSAAATPALDMIARAGAAQTAGSSLFKQGEFQRAALNYSLALRLLPAQGTQQSALLRSNRSAAYAKLGQWEQALEDAEAALKVDGKCAKFWCRKGAALVGLGQAGEALKIYKQALKIDPGYEGARSGLAAAHAAIQEAQRRYDEMWGSSN